MYLETMILLIIKNNMKIVSIYKWYKNPIKYFRDRKKIKLMNEILKYQFKNGRGSNIPEGYSDDGFIK